MKTTNPDILVISFPSTFHLEKELHKKFKQYKDDREWFFKVNELNAFIDEHREKNDMFMNWYNKQLEIKELENNF
jgi:hypothetical protein